ncbi:MAG: copper-binding protein [Robiginitomaculum sp.]|nr:MAG: copper-binding protein [Robiginitomaculum sp.]
MYHVRIFPKGTNTITKVPYQIIVLLVACIALLVPAVTANAQSGGAVKVVTMNDAMQFVPARLTVHSGDQVEWRNGSVLIHTVTADPALASEASSVNLPAGASPFNSGNIKAQGTFQHTFTTPGTYKYFCIPHEGVGMVGEIVVQP